MLELVAFSRIVYKSGDGQVAGEELDWSSRFIDPHNLHNTKVENCRSHWDFFMKLIKIFIFTKQKWVFQALINNWSWSWKDAGSSDFVVCIYAIFKGLNCSFASRSSQIIKESFSEFNIPDQQIWRFDQGQPQGEMYGRMHVYRCSNEAIRL